MLYEINLTNLPIVCEAYEIERKTVWKCADKRNILVLVTAGKCSFTYDGKVYFAEKGQVVFIPEGVEYTRKPTSDESVGLLYAHFSSPAVAIAQSERENAFSSCINGGNTAIIKSVNDGSDKISEVLRKVVACKKSTEPLSNLNASISLAIALSLLCEPIVKEHSSISIADTPYPTAIEKSLEHIRRHFSEKITVPDLCSISFVTPQHLIRLFKKHLGFTPIEYINRNKIARAIEMLRSTELSVKEIAYSLGFDNPNYFSRLFMKEVGLSPLQKKAQIRAFKTN